MKGIYRLLILIAIGIIGGLIVLCVANKMISQQGIADDASKATIVAGVLTFLGIVFTTIYKEISTYYQDKKERGNKRWDLVLPMIKENYMPWISAANSLSNSLKTAQTGTITEDLLNRILFLFSVFYGIRLRNLQKNGGYVLLSSINDEKNVDDAYIKVKNALNWAGDETPNRVNVLQELFVKNEKPDNPYTINCFEEDLKKSSDIQDSKNKLKAWLNPTKAKTAHEALDNFVITFKQKIGKVSSSWDT